MKQEEEKSVGLPDNAFRPLKPGGTISPHHVTKQKISRSKPMVCAMVSPWRYYSRRPLLTWD